MRLSRTIGRVIASTSTPTGTLTKKIHSHPAYFVRTPPKSTPAAAPLPPMAPQMPSALLRSEPSWNVVMMIDSTAGETIAAPTPCITRAAISTPIVLASPHASDAALKIVTPIMNIRRRPSRSAARPPSSSRPPNVIVYAISTHCSVVSDTCSEFLIEGSATVTIVPSRTVMRQPALRVGLVMPGRRARGRRGVRQVCVGCAHRLRPPMTA